MERMTYLLGLQWVIELLERSRWIYLFASQDKSSLTCLVEQHFVCQQLAQDLNVSILAFVPLGLLEASTVDTVRNVAVISTTSSSWIVRLRRFAI